VKTIKISITIMLILALWGLFLTTSSFAPTLAASEPPPESTSIGDLIISPQQPDQACSEEGGCLPDYENGRRLVARTPPSGGNIGSSPSTSGFTASVAEVIAIDDGCPYPDPPGFERRAPPAEDAWICISVQNPVYWAYGHNDALYVRTNASPVEWVRWRPTIAIAARYKVEVSIPSYHSNASKTQQARYRVHHASGDTWVTVNQEAHAGTWYNLGTFRFNAGTDGYVYLESYTPENPLRLLAADAARFALVNQPPNPPNLVSPPNGGSIASPTVSLCLQDTGDPDNYPWSYRDFHYRLEKTDGTWSREHGWTTDTCWTVTVPSEGTYRWRAQSGDGELGSAWTAWWTFGYNAPLVFGSLSGRVTSGSTGAGISNALVTLGHRVTKTDGEGHYQLEHLPLGAYSFAVTKDGYQSHQASVTIAGGDNVRNVSLTPLMNGMTLPLNEKVYHWQGDYVNAYVDLDPALRAVYDYRHPVGSRVNINGRWYTAPWPANVWRIGLAYNGHRGTDYNGHLNRTNVVAAAPGYVVSYWDRSPDGNRSLRANYVVMRHEVKGRTVFINYHHLELGTIPGKIKQATGRNILIPRGELLGKIGLSGNTTGPHLHFEVSDCEGCPGFDPYVAGMWAEGAVAAASDTDTGSLTRVITEPNLRPTATFTVTPVVAQPGTTLTFDASASQDPDGSIVQHVWDLGDGTRMQGQIITQTYSSPGTYYVFLTTLDDRGGAALSESLPVIISEQAGSPGLDTTPPQGTITLAGDIFTSLPTATLQLTLTTTEDSARVMVRFSRDGESYGAWETFTPHKEVNVGTEEGYQYIYAQWTDEAGNLSMPAVATVFRDTTPPTVTFGLPITATWEPGRVSFPWTVEDASSLGDGVLTTEYFLISIDEDWVPADVNNVATYSCLDDGTYTFLVRATDWAGNQTLESLTTNVTVPRGYIYLPLVIRK
jgi:murein DD-endopeptidase MepM/ murein hydrolase activator NlpD